MNSHDLARRLLSLPNLPVATYACNHPNTEEDLVIGLLKHYKGDKKVLVGDKLPIKSPRWDGSHYVFSDIVDEFNIKED